MDQGIGTWRAGSPMESFFSFADPDLISWCLGFVKEGARAAGRDPEQIEVMSARASLGVG